MGVIRFNPLNIRYKEQQGSFGAAERDYSEDEFCTLLTIAIVAIILSLAGYASSGQLLDVRLHVGFTA